MRPRSGGLPLLGLWPGMGASPSVTPGTCCHLGSPQLVAAAPAIKTPCPASPSFPRGMARPLPLIARTEATPQQGLRAPCLWGLEVEGSSQKLSVCQEIEEGSLPISFSSVPSLVPEM